MNYLVEHHLEYDYSEPVWLEPILVRFRPLSNLFQQVESFQLIASPEPAGSSPFIDAAGNNAQRLWFTGLHKKLSLTATTQARTSLENPFEFLLKPEATSIPFSYSDSAGSLLQAYLVRRSVPAVTCLAQRAIDETRGQTVDFLVRLSEIIHNEFRLVKRLRGDPRSPGATLRKQEGSCRDLAVLYAEACRSVGIAARFVSGYAYQPELPAPELHAWCEVYLPGGGWRGFDPSTGLAAGSAYLVLATGPTHHEARPTWGTYLGSARSRLKTRIRIVLR